MRLTRIPGAEGGLDPYKPTAPLSMSDHVFFYRQIVWFVDAKTPRPCGQHWCSVPEPPARKKMISQNSELLADGHQATGA